MGAASGWSSSGPDVQAWLGSWSTKRNWLLTKLPNIKKGMKSWQHAFFFCKEPERNVHEIHPSNQRMVRNATSSRDPDSGLQRQVLENPSSWADPSHHLEQIRHINSSDTQESLDSLMTCSSLTCPNRIEMLAKDLSKKKVQWGSFCHQQNTHICKCQGREKDWGTCGVFYLWTVCEATRKDMRSPADISLLLIKVPPAKIVLRTMPVSRKQEKEYKHD